MSYSTAEMTSYPVESDTDTLVAILMSRRAEVEKEPPSQRRDIIIKALNDVIAELRRSEEESPPA